MRPGTSLDAIGALRRGWANFLANWELLPVQWLLTLAFGLLFVLSLVPIVVAIGWSVFAGAPSTLDGWEEWIAALPAVLASRAIPLAIGVVASLILGTFAVLAYAFLLGGTYGTFWAADRQAPAGTGSAKALFRAFSWNGFTEWGRSRLWTYFWLVHFFVAVFLVVLLFWMLLVLGAVAAFQGYGGFAAVGLGCGGAIPLFFVGLVASFWFQMALVEAGREGATVSTAVRQGWRLLGSRLGSILLLFVLQLVAGMVLGAVFAPVAIISSLAMRDQPGLELAVRMPLQLVQWVISVAVQLVFQAAYVALARDTWPESAQVPLSPIAPPIPPIAPMPPMPPAPDVQPADSGFRAFDRVADDPLPELPETPMESASPPNDAPE